MFVLRLAAVLCLLAVLAALGLFPVTRDRRLPHVDVAHPRLRARVSRGRHDSLCFGAARACRLARPILAVPAHEPAESRLQVLTRDAFRELAKFLNCFR